MQPGDDATARLTQVSARTAPGAGVAGGAPFGTPSGESLLHYPPADRPLPRLLSHAPPCSAAASRRSPIPQTAVRPLRVVPPPPLLDDDPRLAQVGEVL